MRLLLPLLIACGSTPDEPKTGPDPVAAEVLAGRICSLYEMVGTSCTWEGPRASVDGHEWLVSAETTNEIETGGSVLLNLAYDVSLDGKAVPALRGFGVGGGTSRTAAHEQAADDWARVFGSAMIDHASGKGRLTALQALQDDQPAPAAFISGDWVAYPGFTELRGKRTEAKTIDLQYVIDGFQPISSTWSEGTHAIYVRFTRAGSAATEPECFVDGQPSAKACELALAFDWPEGSYLLKQYVVFVSGPLPEGVTERQKLPELQANP